jgi:hypothetical protein
MKHFMRLIMLFIPFAALLACASNPIGYPKPFRGREEGKQWMRSARYGVFVHYLRQKDDTYNWNQHVNEFDLDTFVDQIVQSGAGYVIFTVGQNSGHYCTPNATYDRYCGYTAGDRCSTRDLPMELADALGRHGIRLMLYFTARTPYHDLNAREKFADSADIIKDPAPQEFTKRWSEVLREWAERYKGKVAGWWFDGGYNTAGWDDETKPYNWHTWAAAARAGNPGRLLAFSKGSDKKFAFGRLTDEQDYTAGERNGFDFVPSDAPAPPGMQWHLLGYMGKDWAQRNGPVRSDEWMVDYVRKIIEQGGVISMDVNCVQGHIYEPHFKQLLAIRNGLANSGEKSE